MTPKEIIRPVNRRFAFTLVEALLASTVLAIVAASATLPFAAGVRQAMEASRLQRATAYAQAMMEEVLARPFYGPDGRARPVGPDTGETARTLFDDVDDFHNFTEQATGLRNYNNVAVSDPEAPGWWRDVTTTYVSFAGQQAGDTNCFITVRVRLMDGTTPLVTLYRLVARED